MNPLLYVKLGAAALALFFAAYLGYSFEHSRFVAFKTAIAEETRVAEKQYQAQADQIRIEKDAKIKAINTQLVDAISELRKRPSRTAETSYGQTGQSCNGSELYAEDSIFLTREAARADTIRIALQACYDQYEALK